VSELESVLLTIKIISEQLNTLSEKVSNLTDKIGGTTEKVNKLNNELDTFKQYQAMINKSIEDLQKKVEELERKDNYNTWAKEKKQPIKATWKQLFYILIGCILTLAINLIVINYSNNLKDKKAQVHKPSIKSTSIIKKGN
jgi:uncharacterized coiled-coil DUF342 family protein